MFHSDSLIEDDSPEARILFAANENEDTRQSIKVRIAVLSVAQEGEDGYLSLIEGREELDEEMLSNQTRLSRDGRENQRECYKSFGREVS